MTDYYKILGILPNATTEEIKKAYRQLALKYHPDRNPGDNNSEAFFKKVTEAYSILSDPELRENYNYEYKKSQQTSSNNNQQQRRSEQQLTPQVILAVFQEIRIKVNGISNNQINQSSLFNSLNDLLSINNINFLLSSGDTKINKQIINEVITCCKPLAYTYVDKLSPKLAKLAGSDNETIQKILSFNKQQKYLSYWKKYQGIAIFAATILFVVIVSNYRNNTSSSYSSKPDNQHSNGDLNNTFIDNRKASNSSSNSQPTSSHIPKLTPEQKLQQEKEILIEEGWLETEISNGPLPACYNFIPKKSKIDNYLEVLVGGGTDVAIKVMSLQTDKCVRYVFINSGSTYRIRNIPEGTYYLKIAYGKEWFSKIEGGKCIGRFIRNPLYEKGEEIMDFNLQYTSKGYRIPSFQLKLDVIATNPMNTFDSQKISENEFNQ